MKKVYTDRGIGNEKEDALLVYNDLPEAIRKKLTINKNELKTVQDLKNLGLIKDCGYEIELNSCEVNLIVYFEEVE